MTRDTRHPTPDTSRVSSDAHSVLHESPAATEQRPGILFLTYALATGGSTGMLAPIAEHLGSVGYRVDVSACEGTAASQTDRRRNYRVLLPGQAAGNKYAYVDVAFPFNDGLTDAAQAVLHANPSAALGIRFHSEADFIRAWLRPRTRTLVRSAAVCWFHHAGQAAECQAVLGRRDLPDDHVRIIAPGVDIERFRPGGTDAGSARRYARMFGLSSKPTDCVGGNLPASPGYPPTQSAGLGKRGRPMIVAMAGRASPEKNWLDYIALAGRLRDAYGPRVKCLAITGPRVGWPAGREIHLREIARVNGEAGCPATFTGMLDDWENLLASVDVYVQLSGSESFCRTAAEAQGCGIPVVATAVGGMAACAVRGRPLCGISPEGRETAILVSPPADFRYRLSAAQLDEAFAAVRRLLDDRGLRRRMGRLARERAVAEMDERRSSAETAEEIGRVIWR